MQNCYLHTNFTYDYGKATLTRSQLKNNILKVDAVIHNRNITKAYTFIQQDLSCSDSAGATTINNSEYQSENSNLIALANIQLKHQFASE